MVCGGLLAGTLLSGPARGDDQPTTTIAPEDTAHETHAPALPESPRSAPARETDDHPPLPEKALLGLDDLPPVNKPVNKTYDRPIPPPARRAVKEGKHRLENDNVPGAIEQFKRALDYAPENPELARLLGQAYARLPNYGRAARYLRQAAGYYGDSLIMQRTLAKLARLRKQPDQALGHLRTALVTTTADPADPQTARVLLELSRLLQEQGYWTASLEAVEQLRDWLREHGDNYQDEAQLRQLLLNPETLLHLEGQLLLALRRDEEAIETLDRAYRRNRSRADTARLLLAALIRIDRFDRAKTLLLDLAAQEAHAGYVPRLAEQLVSRSSDPSMPVELWKRYRAKQKVWPALALALARSAAELGNDDDAHRILRSLLQEMPHLPEAVTLQAKLFLRADQPGRALTLLADMVRTNPDSRHALQETVREIYRHAGNEELLRTLSDNANAATGKASAGLHYLAGLLAAEAGKNHLARDHFDKALQADPAFQPVWEALVELALANGDAENLKMLMERVRNQSNEGAFYHYILGVVRLAEDKPALATDALETARNQDPEHLPTLLKLARAYRLRLAQAEGPSVRNVYIRRAIDTLGEVLQLAPQTLSAYRELFDLYADTHQYDKAREVALQLAKQQPSRLEGPLLVARSFLLAEQIPQARQILDDLQDRFPDRPEVRLMAIRCDLAEHPGVLRRNLYRQTVDRLNRLLTRYPDNTAILTTLAELLSRPTPGDYADAAVLWSRLYQEDPTPKIGKALVLTLRMADQHAYAAKVLRDMLRENPDDKELRSLLADTLAAMGKTHEALRMVDDWRKQYTGDYEPRLLSLGLLRKAERYNEAIALLDDLAADPDSSFDPQALRGVKIELLCRAGKLQEARRIVQQEQFNSFALSSAVSGMLNADRSDLAASLLSDALGREDLPPALRTSLRQSLLSVLTRDGKVDEALNRIETWLGDLGAEPAGRKQADMLKVSAVSALVSGGRFERAQKRLDALLADDPNNAELHNLHATVLSELNRDDEALAALQRALQLKPDDEMLQNNFAYFLADAGRELARAEQLATQSVRQSLAEGFRPPASTQDTMAWIYYKQGKFNRAGSIFESVLPDDPDENSDDALHPVIWDHAGDTFYRLGWTDRAVEYWQRAIRLAREEASGTREIRTVLKDTPKKIQAVRQGSPPAVAPLGHLAKPQTAPSVAPTDDNGN